MMRILLLSTYELGHQPVNLAQPAAILRAAGFAVRTVDLALDRFDPVGMQDTDLVAFSIPMHTAARLTVPLVARIRKLRPRIHIAAYGLYAVMNRDYFNTLGVDSILGTDSDSDLLALSRRLENEAGGDPAAARASGTKHPTWLPDRSDLPGLDRYAYLRCADGRRKTVGYVEASQGCKHYCRHCPVVPVFQGRFRAVAREIVLADIRQQVRSGARHITFGDPDFLNGPTHGRRLAEALHAEFPDLTYDVTIKVEHILSNRNLLPILKKTGCLFITSAVESVNDAVLDKLAKGHSRSDFFRLMELLDEAALDLSPTFVPFTPWTTLEDYIDLLRVIADLGLIDSVAPVQLSIRLLIPPGSRLLELDDIKSRVQALEQASFLYPWENPDPRVDGLQCAVRKLAQAAGDSPRRHVFSRIWQAAHRAAGIEAPALPVAAPRGIPAQLSEPWYCCAEPTETQYRFL
ncbi:MAG: CUAEP/CCAEP-tail radical SAM protein [Methylococcaceae bacterium]|nr:CUAEP/CCAEP-tail radical SAM protein [Methylococcaceae bacterium]MCI0732459.1 CUAEP/CCAEP-tail radical SAM protein [Methylococcaceae bacterium]